MNDSTNRISGLLSHDAGDGQGSTTPAPAGHDRTDPRHTTVINSDRPIVSVQFAEDEPDGRWFRLLNWVVDSGAWARISNPARALLIVLARHADPNDGTSLPSLEVMQEQSGFGRSAVLDARAELVEASLIRKTDRGAWEMFPGRPFAQRRALPSPQPRTPSPQLRTPARPQSAVADLKSAAADEKSAAADLPLRLKTRDVVVGQGDDGGGVFQDLVRIGFGRKEASDFIERFGSEKASDALANALFLDSAGRIRKSVKAAVWHLASKGYGLFDEVKKARRKQEAARLVGRLEALPFRRLLEAHEFDLLSSKFPEPAKLAASGLFTSAEIQDLDDAAAAWFIFDRVAEHVGVTPRHPASS